MRLKKCIFHKRFSPNLHKIDLCHNFVLEIKYFNSICSLFFKFKVIEVLKCCNIIWLLCYCGNIMWLLYHQYNSENKMVTTNIIIGCTPIITTNKSSQVSFYLLNILSVYHIISYPFYLVFI